ncbi:MAG: hypothetical protein K6E29_06305 [Cyanobacteria bacterium RUI128]|nr:hypothetical protein [Cyanobacteria bacterium RUI128]
MKLVKLLKFLNKKVEKYDKLAHTNPFTIPRHNYTIVWVENIEKDFPLKDM